MVYDGRFDLPIDRMLLLDDCMVWEHYWIVLFVIVDDVGRSLDWILKSSIANTGRWLYRRKEGQHQDKAMVQGCWFGLQDSSW